MCIAISMCVRVCVRACLCITVKHFRYLGDSDSLCLLNFQRAQLFVISQEIESILLYVLAFVNATCCAFHIFNYD